MNRLIESHIIIALGIAARNGRRPVILNEKLLYMIFFLFSEDHKKLRTKLYHFKKGMYLPESDVLRNCLKQPGFYKECWGIHEDGIKLTDKGVEKYRNLMRLHKDVTEGFTRIIIEMITHNINQHHLEYFIPLKFPNWVTKFTDRIEDLLKARPGVKREDALKYLQNKDVIHKMIESAILTEGLRIGTT